MQEELFCGSEDWLYEILENSPKAKDMIDLTKYLFYKATGTDYGVTEFDFSIYSPENFKSLNNLYGGTSNLDGVVGQIYDFLLARGFPPVGVAAIIGNIQGESSFNSAAVNEIGASGLCQWTNDRLDNLKSLANSKGVSWTDVDVQLEHLCNELENDYPEVRNEIMNATEEEDLEYATWYFGRYYEVFFSYSNDFEATKHETATRYEYAQKHYSEYLQSQQNSGS